jgi:hypothetical protein
MISASLRGANSETKMHMHVGGRRSLSQGSMRAACWCHQTTRMQLVSALAAGRGFQVQHKMCACACAAVRKVSHLRIVQVLHGLLHALGCVSFLQWSIIFRRDSA